MNELICLPLVCGGIHYYNEQNDSMTVIVMSGAVGCLVIKCMELSELVSISKLITI